MLSLFTWLGLYTFWGVIHILRQIYRYEGDGELYYDPSDYDPKSFRRESTKSECYCPDDIDLPYLENDDTLNDDPYIPVVNLSVDWRYIMGRESVNSECYCPVDVYFYNGVEKSINDVPFNPEEDVPMGCTYFIPMGEHPKSKCYNPDDYKWVADYDDTLNDIPFISDKDLRYDPKDLFNRESKKSECYCEEDAQYIYNNDKDINNEPIIPEFDCSEIYNYFLYERYLLEAQKKLETSSKFMLSNDYEIYANSQFLDFFYLFLGTF